MTPVRALVGPNPLLRAAGATAGLLAAGHLLPSVGTVPALHRRLLPVLSGRSRSAQVALTFDDGPDPATTPLFLAELARLRLRATFFVLGSRLLTAPDLGRQILAEGHELAVHGWLHRPHLLRAPWRIEPDLARTVEQIEAVGGRPRFWRPPNGVLTGAGLLAARRHRLQPVLWTVDGRDWTARATSDTVLARLRGGLAAGGTVLLHDSDVTSAPGAWRSALGALAPLAGLCRDRGWSLGPLAEHWR